MGQVNYDFLGKSILVTGGSSGIGYAIAARFAEAGAQVTILANEGVEDAVERLRKETRTDIRGLTCDITDREHVRDSVETLNVINVLINNAGLELVTPLDDPDDAVEDRFRRIIDVNVNGTFLMTRYAVPKIPRGGRIIFTASIWSRTAVAEFSAYCASKHATLGLVRSFAHELAPRQISVNAVCPGWVKTPASMRSLAAMVARSDKTEQEVLDEIVSAQAFGGLMEPPDMADLYLFLASDAARNITGQAYGADRGEVMA